MTEDEKRGEFIRKKVKEGYHLSEAKKLWASEQQKNKEELLNYNNPNEPILSQGDFYKKQIRAGKTMDETRKLWAEYSAALTPDQAQKQYSSNSSSSIKNTKVKPVQIKLLYKKLLNSVYNNKFVLLKFLFFTILFLLISFFIAKYFLSYNPLYLITGKPQYKIQIFSPGKEYKLELKYKTNEDKLISDEMKAASFKEFFIYGELVEVQLKSNSEYKYSTNLNNITINIYKNDKLIFSKTFDNFQTDFKYQN